MKVYAVKVNRDDTVQVISAEVNKETPQFYMITFPSGEDRYAFGYSNRLPKCSPKAALSERNALERYMAKRQLDRDHAKSVIGQANKQIASANELLMHLPPDERSESAPSDPAVVANIGTTTA